MININAEVDEFLEKWNKDVRNTKDTTFGILSDSIGKDIHYSDGLLFGLDSATRTGDCVKITRSNSTSYDCRIGLRLLLLSFPRVIIGEDVMSLAVRVRNNSIHVSYTVIHNNTNSKDKYLVEVYEVEEFDDVELSASLPEYDGADVNSFFRTTVKELADGILKDTLDDSSEESSEEEQEGELIPGQRMKQLMEFHRISK